MPAVCFDLRAQVFRSSRRAADQVIRAGLLGTRHSHTTGKLKAMQDSPDYEVVGVAESDPEAKSRARKGSTISGVCGG